MDADTGFTFLVYDLSVVFMHKDWIMKLDWFWFHRSIILDINEPWKS